MEPYTVNAAPGTIVQPTMQSAPVAHAAVINGTNPQYYAVNTAPGTVAQPASQTIPMQGAPPLTAPMPNYPQHIQPQAAANAQTSQVLSAGILGLIVGATGTMGVNLHKVGDGDMTLSNAAVDSIVKGAKAGIATAIATAASTSLTGGGITGLAITLATATGAVYLLNP